MAEYIDRDKVLRELECGIRAGNYEEGYEDYMHINDMDDCVDTIKYFDTADVVEREKVKSLIEVAIEDGWELDYALERLKEI